MTADCRLCGLPVDELAYVRFNSLYAGCEAENYRRNIR